MPRIKTKPTTDGFDMWLERQGASKSTREAYIFALRQYKANFGEVSPEGLSRFKSWLADNFNIKTANLRIVALNVYLKFIDREKWRQKTFKIQQKPFLENVISESDYEFLKSAFKKDGNERWYFIVRFLGATGARASEFVRLKIEHVYKGHFDLYGKGAKMRRLYIPANLQKDALEWLEREGRTTGYLFSNKYGKQMTPCGLASMLRKYAKKYGLDPKVTHPHSFRHMFAKSFLQRHNDISFLADLMGHESIETTRIYLRKTATEQREIVDKIIVW